MKEGESHMHNTPAATCVKKELHMLSPEEMLFFAARPEDLELYEQFRARLLSEVGEVRVKAAKTQISFTGKHGFAFVSHPRRKKDRGIVVPSACPTSSSPRAFSAPQSRIPTAGRIMSWCRRRTRSTAS